MGIVIKPVSLYFQQMKQDGDGDFDHNDSEEDEDEDGSEEDDGEDEDDDEDESEDQEEGERKPRKSSQNDSDMNGPTRDELEKTAEGQYGLSEDDGLVTGIVKSPKLNYYMKAWCLNVLLNRYYFYDFQIWIKVDGIFRAENISW